MLIYFKNQDFLCWTRGERRNFKDVKEQSENTEFGGKYCCELIMAFQKSVLLAFKKKESNQPSDHVVVSKIVIN